MTVQRRDGNQTPLEHWIRNNPGLDSREYALSVTDSDWWIHKFRVHGDRCGERLLQHIMFVELKTFGADLPPAQRDTLAVIAAAMRTENGNVRSFRMPLWNINNWQTLGTRTVKCWGCHVLRMSGSNPSDSEWMKWDKKDVDEETLIEILRFDRNPYTTAKYSDRRHHKDRRLRFPF